VSYNVLLFLEFFLQVSQLIVVSVDGFLIGYVFALQLCLLHLRLLELFGKFPSQPLELLAVVYVLLQLIANELAVLLSDLFLLEQLPLQLAEVIQL